MICTGTCESTCPAATEGREALLSVRVKCTATNPGQKQEEEEEEEEDEDVGVKDGALFQGGPEEELPFLRVGA